MTISGAGNVGYIWFDPSEGTARLSAFLGRASYPRVTFGSTRLRVLQGRSPQQRPGRGQPVTFGSTRLRVLQGQVDDRSTVRVNVTFGSTRLRVLQGISSWGCCGGSLGYIWFDPSEGTARHASHLKARWFPRYIWFDPSEGTARSRPRWLLCYCLRVTFGSTRLRVLQG